MPKDFNAGVSAVIRRDDGKILVGKRAMTLERAPGLWALPGGHVDPNETLMNAVHREVHEETNLEISLRYPSQSCGDGYIPAMFVTDQSPVRNCLTFWFEASPLYPTNMQLQNMEPHKCDGWMWIRLNDLCHVADMTKAEQRSWLPMSLFRRYLDPDIYGEF